MFAARGPWTSATSQSSTSFILCSGFKCLASETKRIRSVKEALNDWPAVPTPLKAPLLAVLCFPLVSDLHGRCWSKLIDQVCGFGPAINLHWWSAMKISLGFQVFGLHSLCKQRLISHSVFPSHPVWLPYDLGDTRNTGHVLKGLFLGYLPLDSSR